MTVTAPGFGVMGQGKAVFNASVTGDVPSPILSASTAEGPRRHVSRALVGGGGCDLAPRGTAIHTTAEWFSAVDAYDILQPEPAQIAGRPRPSRSCTRARRTARLLRPRARAARQQPSGALRRSGAQRVRLRAATRQLRRVGPDRRHRRLHPRTGRATLAFGLGYAWGTNRIPQAVVPPEQTEPPVLREAHFSRWTISVGRWLSLEGGRCAASPSLAPPLAPRE